MTLGLVAYTTNNHFSSIATWFARQICSLILLLVNCHIMNFHQFTRYSMNYQNSWKQPIHVNFCANKLHFISQQYIHMSKTGSEVQQPAAVRSQLIIRECLASYIGLCQLHTNTVPCSDDVFYDGKHCSSMYVLHKNCLYAAMPGWERLHWPAVIDSAPHQPYI